MIRCLKVFILQQWGNEKYNTNTPPVDMADRRIHLAPTGWAMDMDSDEDLGGELPSKLDFAFCLPAMVPPTNKPACLIS